MLSGPEFKDEASLRSHYAAVRERFFPTVRKRRPVTSEILPPRPAPLLAAPPKRARDWLLLGSPAVWPPQEMGAAEAALPHWKRIAIEVARKHNVTFAELKSNRRSTNLVSARYEAMYRMKKETSMSFPAIGRQLGGKDHTTVLYGIRKHTERMAQA